MIAYRQVIKLTSLQAGLLFLKVFRSHNLQQRVEEGHIGQLTDQDERLERDRHSKKERKKKKKKRELYFQTFHQYVIFFSGLILSERCQNIVSRQSLLLSSNRLNPKEHQLAKAENYKKSQKCHKTKTWNK